MMIEFQCKKCDKQYEEFVHYDPTNKYKTVECPFCQSKKKTKLFSACKHSFVNPEGTGKMNTHEYRARYAIDKPGGAKDQREFAEQFSHVGPKPYNTIDDINNGDHFGEVK
jgi:DNA-directed RNA polymerase subunit RPC12/RpoP